MAVQDALTHAVNLWKRIVPKEYPNGAVVFCSEDLAEIFHPPMPLKGRVYDCGRQFKTSVIQDAINTQLGPAHGLIVIDGSDAAFGKVQGLGISVAAGPVITDLGHLGAHIAGRTRRGGQSALRYSRLRDESELAFLRKVAEKAATLLSEVSGIIVAGKADMKHKLVAELPGPLKKQVMCTVDLSCNAGPEGLRLAALRAVESVVSAGDCQEDRDLQQFLELTLKEELMCCYGEAETVRALQMGAVDRLLLSADLQTNLSADEWKSLAAWHGTRIVEIHPRTEKGSEFCKSFGVGACFRWPLEEHLLQDDEDHNEEDSEEIPINASGTLGIQPPSAISKEMEELEVASPQDDIDRESSSTADTLCGNTQNSEALAWFQAEVNDALGDLSAAEALTACVEVVLSDEVTAQDEILEGLTAIICAEGLPEELAAELMRRW
jgi:peptide subunit release factor 1 (eRF1)